MEINITPLPSVKPNLAVQAIIINVYEKKETLSRGVIYLFFRQRKTWRANIANESFLKAFSQ